MSHRSTRVDVPLARTTSHSGAPSPGIVNEHNFHEYPIPAVKLTRLPYQQFKTVAGRYILSDEHPLCIWHQQLKNKPWDRTVASLSYARSRYREWFILKKDRASKR